jgi:hypothetical protein
VAIDGHDALDARGAQAGVAEDYGFCPMISRSSRTACDCQSPPALCATPSSISRLSGRNCAFHSPLLHVGETRHRAAFDEW